MKTLLTKELKGRTFKADKEGEFQFGEDTFIKV